MKDLRDHLALCEPCRKAAIAARIHSLGYSSWVDPYSLHHHAPPRCLQDGSPLSIEAELEDLTAERDRYKAALGELVALKELKETHSKTVEYLRRQPLAWQRAREALHPTPADPPLGQGGKVDCDACKGVGLRHVDGGIWPCATCRPIQFLEAHAKFCACGVGIEKKDVGDA